MLFERWPALSCVRRSPVAHTHLLALRRRRPRLLLVRPVATAQPPVPTCCCCVPCRPTVTHTMAAAAPVAMGRTVRAGVWMVVCGPCAAAMLLTDRPNARTVDVQTGHDGGAGGAGGATPDDSLYRFIDKDRVRRAVERRLPRAPTRRAARACQVVCLNERDSGAAARCFRPWEQRLDRSVVLESDVDAQLLIYVPYVHRPAHRSRRGRPPLMMVPALRRAASPAT